MTATAARHPETTTRVRELPTTAEPSADPATRAELAARLGPGCFPATQDELQATLIRLRAPAHLMWLLMPLAPTRRYSSLDEVLDDLDHPSLPVGPREPF